MRRVLLIFSACLLLVMSIAGCSKPESNSPLVGKWTAIEYSAAGLTIDSAELGESTLDIRANGKLTAMFMGEGGDGSWKETEDGMILKTGGEEIPLSLVDGRLVMDYEGLTITYQKDGEEVAVNTKVPEPTAVPEPDATEAEVMDPDVSGRYGIISAVQNGNTIDPAGLKAAYLDFYYIELKSDGTCIVQLDSEAPCTWKDGVISADENNETINYEIAGELLTTSIGDLTMVFSKNAKPVTPEVGLAPVQDNWNGTWYGLLWITLSSGEYKEYEDYYMDAYMVIDVDDQGEGLMEIYLNEGEEWSVSSAITADETHFEVVEGLFWDMELDPSNWWVGVLPVDEGTKVVIPG